MNSPALVADVLLRQGDGFYFFSSASYEGEVHAEPCPESIKTVWLPPECVAVYALPQAAYRGESKDSIYLRMGGRGDTHVLSAHPVGDYVVWVMVERSLWQDFKDRAQRFGGESRVLASLDLWLWQHTLTGETVVYDNGQMAYEYGCDARGLYREQRPSLGACALRSETSLHAPWPGCVLAACTEEPRPFWGRRWLVAWTLCVCALSCVVGLCHAYRLWKEARGTHRDPHAMLGDPKFRTYLNTYFNQVIDPLTEMKHPNSFIEQMIFKPLQSEMTLVGLIGDAHDLEAWLALRAFPAYRQVEVSMIPKNPDIQKILDQSFSVHTEHGDGSYAMLLIEEEPKLVRQSRARTATRGMTAKTDRLGGGR